MFSIIKFSSRLFPSSHASATMELPGHGISTSQAGAAGAAGRAWNSGPLLKLHDGNEEFPPDILLCWIYGDDSPRKPWCSFDCEVWWFSSGCGYLHPPKNLIWNQQSQHVTCYNQFPSENSKEIPNNGETNKTNCSGIVVLQAKTGLIRTYPVVLNKSL